MRGRLEEIDERTWRLYIEIEGRPLSWVDVAALLVREPELRMLLREQILAVPFAAVYWEARPVDPGDRDAPFECVVIDAPGFNNMKADGRPFAGALAEARSPEVRTFANLGGDAELVVPAPSDGDAIGYPHLSAFLRRAPEEQVHALWVAVGLAVERWLDERGSRVWVSTSGGGVAWLHVRLDSRPKYVKWAAYRAVR